MKRFPAFCLILLLTINAFPAFWGNGGKSKSINKPIFGAHDWIGYEGFLLASKDHNLKWLDKNMNAFFIGTEAPDFAGAAKLVPGAGKGYGDSVHCHCILFGADGKVTNDRLKIRVQEEFDKAKDALKKKKYQLAAFYLGTMAHYLGDLSQFMHLMGKKSHWGSENQKIHSAYEKVVNESIQFMTHTSSLLEDYVHKKSIEGNTAAAVAETVARFTETGGDDGLTTGAMYKEFKKYYDNGKINDSDNWDKAFLDQTGANVNTSINGVAKLLAKFAKN